MIYSMIRFLVWGFVFAFRCSALLLSPHQTYHSHSTTQSELALYDRSQKVSEISGKNIVLLSRQNILSSIGSSLLGLNLLLSPSAFAEGGEVRIKACVKPAEGGPSNCVSTASVKQVDLYISPWTWPDGISADEVAGRLKGAIASDSTLTLEEQRENRYFRTRAVRNFCTDEIEFVINPVDRAVTFRSLQIEGPDNVSDFGANRKRLDEIRRRTAVLEVMGAEFNSADSAPREGTVDQLKAFWGLQSGGGYESVLLDNDDE